MAKKRFTRSNLKICQFLNLYHTYCCERYFDLRQWNIWQSHLLMSQWVKIFFPKNHSWPTLLSSELLFDPIIVRKRCDDSYCPCFAVHNCHDLSFLRPLLMMWINVSHENWPTFKKRLDITFRPSGTYKDLVGCHAIIIHSWFETTLNYKPKVEEFPCLVHKLSEILTALHYKYRQWKGIQTAGYNGGRMVNIMAFNHVSKI